MCGRGGLTVGVQVWVERWRESLQHWDGGDGGMHVLVDVCHLRRVSGDAKQRREKTASLLILHFASLLRTMMKTTSKFFEIHILTEPNI